MNYFTPGGCCQSMRHLSRAGLETAYNSRFFGVLRCRRIAPISFHPYFTIVAIMPIYAYRCDACGHRKDVLQKMSDPLLTICPSCGEASFAKQLSAPAFQLKGSGWYVTDFRDNGKKAEGDAAKAVPAGEAGAKSDGADKGAGDKGAGDKKSDSSANGAGAGDGKGSASGPGAAPAAAPVVPAKPAGPTGAPVGGSSAS
jgi:putative FmdB family regulatory protein